jgi:tetratricopeptide (TPR) repeat protein
MLATTQGRLSEAIELYRQTLELDPLSPAAYNNLGIALHAAGRGAEAETAYRKALELAPLGSSTHSFLSLALAAQGRREKALAEAMREPNEVFRLWALGIVHHTMGHGAESEAALQALIDRYGEVAAYQVAEVHGVRGEADAAFELLERAYAQRDGGLTGLRTSQHLRSLHGDPRWGAFLKKMAFEG